jgi:hypothetical protein
MNLPKLIAHRVTSRQLLPLRFTEVYDKTVMSRLAPILLYAAGS